MLRSVWDFARGLAKRRLRNVEKHVLALGLHAQQLADALVELEDRDELLSRALAEVDQRTEVNEREVCQRLERLELQHDELKASLGLFIGQLQEQHAQLTRHILSERMVELEDERTQVRFPRKALSG